MQLDLLVRVLRHGEALCSAASRIRTKADATHYASQFGLVFLAWESSAPFAWPHIIDACSSLQVVLCHRACSLLFPTQWSKPSHNPTFLASQ